MGWFCCGVIHHLERTFNMKLQMRIRSLVARQRGQGMTEYIIIVALIALAAIGVYSAFGGVVRGQTAVMSRQLAGEATADARTATTTHSTNAVSQSQAGASLQNYQDRGAASTGGASTGGASTTQ
jgi:type IV pilus assembly protein PilA